MAAMLAASLGSVASASESGITFPLEESYSFSIMTRAENDSEQDFSKKALVQRMEAATNVQVDYQTIPADQFDEKSKLALSKKGMPDVITKMYIKPYDILSYASKGVFIPIEDYIEEDMRLHSSSGEETGGKSRYYFCGRTYLYSSVHQ